MVDVLVLKVVSRHWSLFLWFLLVCVLFWYCLATDMILGQDIVRR